MVDKLGGATPSSPALNKHPLLPTDGPGDSFIRTSGLASQAGESLLAGATTGGGLSKDASQALFLGGASATGRSARWVERTS